MAYSDSRPIIDPAIDVFKRAFDFTGRSRRTDGISYYLALVILTVPLHLLSGGLLFGASKMSGGVTFGLALGSLTIFSIATVAAQFPLLAWLARRMHDHGWSAWWLLALVPLMILTNIGLPPIVESVFALAGIVGLGCAALWEPDYQTNRFGPNPRFHLDETDPVE